jgi:putative ABC transport system ATP-binding protein
MTAGGPDTDGGAKGSDGVPPEHRSPRAMVLETVGITRTYGEGEAAVHALRGVDFELRESEFLVLLGASGSGKSTLMNIIGGLDRPTDGEVRFRGDDLSGADDSDLTEFRRNKEKTPGREIRW